MVAVYNMRLAPLLKSIGLALVSSIQFLVEQANCSTLTSVWSPFSTLCATQVAELVELLQEVTLVGWLCW